MAEDQGNLGSGGSLAADEAHVDKTQQDERGRKEDQHPRRQGAGRALSGQKVISLQGLISHSKLLQPNQLHATSPRSAVDSTFLEDPLLQLHHGLLSHDFQQQVVELLVTLADLLLHFALAETFLAVEDHHHGALHVVFVLVAGGEFLLARLILLVEYFERQELFLTFTILPCYLNVVSISIHLKQPSFGWNHILDQLLQRVAIAVIGQRWRGASFGPHWALHPVVHFPHF